MITWAGDKHRDIAGLNVKQIARRWGRSALDTYLQLVDDTQGQGRVLMHKYLCLLYTSGPTRAPSAARAAAVARAVPSA